MAAPNLVLFLFFMTLALGCSSTPPPSSAPSLAPAQKSLRKNAEVSGAEEKSPYTFESLQNAAQYLSVIVQKRVDEKSKGVKLRSILSCDPTQAKAEAMLMGLQSLIDTQSERELQDYLASPNRNLVRSKHWDQCDAACLCGDYAELIEKIDPEKRSEFDIRLQQELRKKHALLSKKSELTCAMTAEWFCKSELRKDLLERLN